MALVLVLTLGGLSPRADAATVDLQPPIVGGEFVISPDLKIAVDRIRPDGAYLNDVHLRRAIRHFTQGDYEAVVDELSQCDWTRADPEMDRGAFLLGMSYLRLGHRAGFLKLANSVPARSTSPFLACLRRQAILLSHHAAVGPFELSDSVLETAIDEGLVYSASVLALRGDMESADRILVRAPRSILSEYLHAMVAQARGEDVELHLQEIVRQEPTTDLEIQLTGLAQLRLAQRAADQGADPVRWLQNIDPASRWASHGSHLKALYLLEAGDSLAAGVVLADLIEADPAYERRDEIERVLGSMALARNDREGAYRWFAAAARSWESAWATLESFAEPAQLDRVVRNWEREPSISSVLVLDANGFREDLAQQLGLALDLGGEGAIALPTHPLGEVSDLTTSAHNLPHPPVQELRAIGAAQVAAEESYYRWERNQWKTEQARTETARRRLYLERGRANVDRVLLSLDDISAHVALLAGELPRVLADLSDLEIEMQRQIAERTNRILEMSADLRLRLAALDHFYVKGPHLRRAESPPESFPSPGQVMDAEEGLSESLSQVTGSFAEVVPLLIHRSASEFWGPRLSNGIVGLGEEVARLVAQAETIRSAIDDSIVTLDRGDHLAELGAEGRRLRTRADQLAIGHQMLGREVATRVLERRRNELSRRKEGVDYTLAYAHFLTGQPLSAIRLYDDFLGHYPKSQARAEVHYRLAELHLETAKARFRAEMEQLVTRQQRGEAVGVVPVLDLDATLRHYETILQIDLPFAHLDAVLYHVGVIRADEGDPAGVDFLERLVAEYPGSRFVQEAQVRRADFYFDDGREDRAAELYAAGAVGPDPALQAIALYKLGWSFFNRDEFLNAARAFSRVLDLYDSEVEFEVDVDLRTEADDYLIHALARLGGGGSALRFFDETGERPYTSAVILGVSSLLRRFSLYAQAVETDEGWLRRYPQDRHALVVAKQIVDGHQQGNQLGRARASRLEMADLFLAGSEWYEANPSESLRNEADRFAEYSYRNVALFHHHEARDGRGSDGEFHWRESLKLYVRMLVLWPGSPDRARTEFYSGEAARELGHYDEAASYFAAAADADSASFALEASWQQVATLQGWYAESPEERDELVGRVLAAGDVFLERSPFDLRGNDLSWSQAQLAFAHSLDGRAADDFARFVARYPGDERAPRAASFRGDALYRLSRYDDAGSAYDEASRVAQAAGDDSLAQRMRSLVPHSFYLHAESVDPTLDTTLAADAFADVALRWPDFEFADHALYRAARGYLAAGSLPRAESAFEELLRRYPESSLARDSYLELAGTYERAQRIPEAARALEAFSAAFPADEEADDALLHAADLWNDFGDEPSSERVQLLYVDRYPEDTETAVFVLHRMARKDLRRAESRGAVSWVLEDTGESPSYLTRYLKLEKESGKVFDPGIAAQVSFLLGEEGRADYLATGLTLPLDQSIAQKNTRLEAMLLNYRRSIAAGVSPWSQAAVFRIGEALVAFGEGLVGSERPADLLGDDRLGYDEVLEEQAWEFYDRGEDVWSQMLQNLSPDLEDEGGWIERTRTALWPRIAQRFLHYAEVDYPVVEAIPVPVED